MGKKIISKKLDPQPLIFREGTYNQNHIEKLARNKHALIFDIYSEQLEELFEITYPTLWNSPDQKKRLVEFKNKRMSGRGFGNWVYFPWRNSLVHILGNSDLQKLRTNRNRDLITKAEQSKLASATVAFAGLSIGNSMSVSLAYSGIANRMRLADFDTLSTANLNRIRSSLVDVGTSKVQMTAHHIFEVNPYASLQLFEEGLNQKTLVKFLADPKPAIVFEAIDDFEMKVRIRLACKKAKIPVVMLTNLGDSVLVDVERYDTDKKLKIFNGLIGDVPEQILKKPITEADKSKYAVSIVGRENVPPRAMASLSQIHKTLVGRPQLMSTVTIGGGFAAYLARKIILGEKVKSGRIRIAFDELLTL